MGDLINKICIFCCEYQI